MILYWLSRGNSAADRVRANLMVFFMFCGIVLIAAYATQDLFTAQTLALSLLLGVPYLGGVAIGARFFHGASERLYRRVAYAIIVLRRRLAEPAGARPAALKRRDQSRLLRATRHRGARRRAYDGREPAAGCGF